MIQTREQSREALVRWFKGICRESGLRATAQRLEVLLAIARCTSHPAAEDIHRSLRGRMPTLSLDTVYRALALFERQGVLVRLWGPDGRFRFDPNTAPHHHLVCERCGEIKDFAWPGLAALGEPDAARAWGRVSRIQAEVRGLCPACARKEAGRDGPRRRAPARAREG